MTDMTILEHIEQSPAFEHSSNGIIITVRVMYLEEQSTPEEGLYVWAYFIRIENTRSDTVQLMHRHWFITDMTGSQHEVEGEGVVGKKPTLSPGEHFEYASGVPLAAPSGIMNGHYEMQCEDESRFIVDIPAFSLDSPEQIERPN